MTMEIATENETGSGSAFPTTSPFPWDRFSSNYPFSGPTWEQLSYCLNYSVLAPSNRNSQPWKFELGIQDVRLFADRTRAMAVVDPHDRELLISCGAALFHLSLAIRYFGHSDEVFLFPDSANPDFLALVQIGSPRSLQDDEHAMFRAISRRHTCRGPFDNRSVPPATITRLCATAAREGASLTIIDDPAGRQKITELIVAADHVQLANAAFRRELASWIRPSRSRTHDGMPGYASGLNRLFDLASLLSSFALRNFSSPFDIGISKAIAARDQKLSGAAPVIAVLSTPADTPAAWLDAGGALARVLLMATAESPILSASFFNQPLEVDRFRLQIRSMIHCIGFPQIILRIGYAPETVGTSRRNLRDVLC